MIPITIDDQTIEVYADRVLWSPPSAAGKFVDAPAEYAKMARALVLCDYEDRDGHTFVNDCELHERFVDSHDDKGKRVPGGRDSGLSFPLKSGMARVRATRVQTGTLRGGGKPDQKIVVVLEWDDPLNAVITATEASERFGIVAQVVREAVRFGYIPSRKSGKTLLIRAADAQKRWK